MSTKRYGDNSTEISDAEIKKIAAFGLVGASVEWFDFFLFGTAAALVFPKLFFPQSAPFTAVLMSFATLGVGFIARPLGGAIWGHYGDKYGRKKAFLAALLTMAAASMLIGLMPTYATIGIAAPIMLSILRFVQGLAVGGQWGGAVLLATEQAPSNKRGYYGSFTQMGVPVGLLFGVCAYFGLSKLMGPEAFLTYGWRIPFVASIVLVGVAILAKHRMEDSVAFKRLQAKSALTQGSTPQSSRSPVFEVIRRYWGRILLTGGAFTVVNATFYLYATFLLDYGTRTLKMGAPTVLLAVALGGVVMIPFLAVFAALSDRVGRRSVYVSGAALTALWAFPLFWLVDTATFSGFAIAITVGLIGIAMMYGPLAAFFTELFTAELRYSGASLGYQLGALLGGAISPLVAVALLNTTGSTHSVSLYVVGLSVLAIVCVMALTETAGSALDAVQGPARSKPTDFPRNVAASSSYKD